MTHKRDKKTPNSTVNFNRLIRGECKPKESWFELRERLIDEGAIKLALACGETSQQKAVIKELIKEPVPTFEDLLKVFIEADQQEKAKPRKIKRGPLDD